MVDHRPRSAFISSTTAYSQAQSPYIQLAPAFSANSESRDQAWPVPGSGDFTSFPGTGEDVADVWATQYHEHVPQAFPSDQTAADHPGIPALEVSPVNGPTYHLAIDTPTLTSRHDQYVGIAQFPFGVMGGIDHYPSPHSGRGTRRHSIATIASPDESIARSPGMGNQTSPSSEGSGRAKISIKRGEPPRNEQEQIYCNHPDCMVDPPVFRRPCEWK